MFSYVVARDYGFAPNPFGEFCTLATCKPEIRRLANVGDWIVGTGSGSAKWRRRGYLVYAMKVSEAMSFDQYWADPRFQNKKPNLRASRKLAFGDNIYHLVGSKWAQLDSHHSLPGGAPNQSNILNDTQANRVLIAKEYAYWGGSGPEIPCGLRSFQGHDLCIGRGYKRHFPPKMVDAFIAWFMSLGAQGCLGRPSEWGSA